MASSAPALIIGFTESAISAPQGQRSTKDQLGVFESRHRSICISFRSAVRQRPTSCQEEQRGGGTRIYEIAREEGGFGQACHGTRCWVGGGEGRIEEGIALARPRKGNLAQETYSSLETELTFRADTEPSTTQRRKADVKDAWPSERDAFLDRWWSFGVQVAEAAKAIQLVMSQQ
eukprot:6202783-Pleurochrysis_carterae.AAC.3